MVSSLVVLPSGELVASTSSRVLRWVPPGPPSIADQPTPAYACAGAASFSVTAAGPGPFTYQWQWRPAPSAPWVDVTDGLNTDPQGGTNSFVAANTSTATLAVSSAGVGSGPPGSHWDARCVVTTPCGSVTSDAATLSICTTDFNCDGFLMGDDYTAFINAFEAGDMSADYNDDGFVMGDDYTAFINDFLAGCP
jgi:hypothetical protein